MMGAHLLMTGAGAPGGPGILRCLREDSRLSITVSDADPLAAGRFLHDRFILLPKGVEPYYAEAMLQLCRHHGITAVLPLTTAELLPLAGAADRFRAQGITLLTATQDVLITANNKTATYAHLQQHGVPVPRYRVVAGIEDFDPALDALGYPDIDLCFKPSVGNGSRGFRRLSERGDRLAELFGRKPGALALRRSEARSILSSGPFPELLVSEYVEGPEYSVDCLVVEGRPPLILPRLREKMSGGITVRGTYEQHEGIIRYCRQVVQALPMTGIFGLQLRLNREGEPLLLEINPRVQGTVSAALGAGVNLPALWAGTALFGDADPWPQMAWGTRFTRYWSEVFFR